MWLFTGNEDLVLNSSMRLLKMRILKIFYLNTHKKHGIIKMVLQFGFTFISFECFFSFQEAITFLHRRKPLAERRWPATTSHFIGPMKYSVH